MLYTQRAQLVTDSVTPTGKQDDQHVVCRELALQSRFEISRIGLGLQKVRQQKPECSLCLQVNGWDTLQRAHGFDAVIHGADAGRQPDPLWRRSREGRV